MDILSSDQLAVFFFHQVAIFSATLLYISFMLFGKILNLFNPFLNGHLWEGVNLAAGDPASSGCPWARGAAPA